MGVYIHIISKIALLVSLIIFIIQGLQKTSLLT